jgi:two-component system, OmpR family, phosphate regulon sensor histidine kinase PhoR
VERLYEYNNNEFPLKNPINKISNDYYIVNVNNEFDADVLEYCLKSEFERSNLITDFEYAIYNCESDEMVYGNYISFNDKSKSDNAFHFPKQRGLVYYFAIRFPHETNYLVSSMKFWIILSFILLLILLIYIYSVFTILQQKKYSALQKDFINNMTHEFKTPLSSILIAATYLSKQEKISTDNKLQKYTGMIIDQGNKLNEHIEQILSISRSDHAPLQMRLKKFKPVNIIEKVVEGLILKYDKIAVTLECPNRDLEITADEFHFSNIVYNLVDNSIKYCEGTPRIRIRIEEKDRVVIIEFTDNGIGIPEQHISRIFDKFYRIPDHKNGEVNGFGLGLYYVKKIVSLHKWKIKAVNNDGPGITISITMPKE